MFKGFATVSLILIISISLKIFAQETDFIYPDTVRADSTARIFSPGFISLPGTQESGLVFSSDGKELLFTRAEIKDKETSSQIFSSLKKGDIWTTPSKVSFSSGFNESEPAYWNDGKTLFFFSERRKPGITSYIGEIWMIKKSGSRWEQPLYPENILNEAWIQNISATPSGRIYFSSYRNKKIGIYYCDYSEGKFSEPVFLPDEINGIAGASNPFVSADESMMVFEGRSAGFKKSEIYISFRTSSGLWTPAIKMNEKVNESGNESNPSLSPDSKYLFFSRGGDIYWIRLEYVF